MDENLFKFTFNDYILNRLVRNIVDFADFYYITL